MYAAGRQSNRVGILALKWRAFRAGCNLQNHVYGRIRGIADRRYEGRRRSRAARGRAGRQRTAAQNDIHLVDRNARLVAHNLSNHRISAGADVLRSAADECRAVVAQVDRCLTNAAIGAPGRGSHTPSKDQIAFPHRPNFRRTPRPAKPLRAHLETFFEVPRREGSVLLLIHESVQREPQFHGIFLQLDGELVHGGFEREQTREQRPGRAWA